MRLSVFRAEPMRTVRYAGELHGEAKDEAITKARAMIVPSVWWEPLGLVVYEAYDYCRPVLAARSGGLPEIVIDGETGLLHQPGNAEEIAQHVRQFEANTRTRIQMGRQGRAWLEQNAILRRNGRRNSPKSCSRVPLAKRTGSSSTVYPRRCLRKRLSYRACVFSGAISLESCRASGGKRVFGTVVWLGRRTENLPAAPPGKPCCFRISGVSLSMLRETR